MSICLDELLDQSGLNFVLPWKAPETVTTLLVSKRNAWKASSFNHHDHHHFLLKGNP